PPRRRATPPPTPTLVPYTTLFRSRSASAPAPPPATGLSSPVPSALCHRDDDCCHPPESGVAGWGDAGYRPRDDASLAGDRQRETDRKSTRLNSSHSQTSYAVFCLK